VTTSAVIILAPSSFGNLLNRHAHCQGVSSPGVFDRESTFHGAPPNPDFSVLDELFRNRTLTMRLQNGKTSRDEGEIPEDEVYDLDVAAFTGSDNASVVLYASRRKSFGEIASSRYTVVGEYSRSDKGF